MSSMRTAAAFTTYYDKKEAKARANARANPNKMHKPGKNTLEVRERHLRHLKAVLVEEDITHIGLITQDHVDRAFEECVDSMEPRLDDVPSPNTIRNAASSFKAFIKWHGLHGAIPQHRVPDLLENLPSIEAYKRRMLIIQGELWPDIFKLAHKRHIMDRVLLELAYRLAMRVSEALSVRWMDFSDDLSEVQFHRDKRNDTLTFKTPEALRETLVEVRQWLTDMGTPPEPKWPIVLARRPIQHGPRALVDPSWPCQPGVPMDRNSARRGLRCALLAFGITPMQMICQGMHIARRSKACALFRQNVDIRIIAKILGHKSYLTTLDYIRDGLDEAEVKAAMDLPDKPVQDVDLFIPAEQQSELNLPAMVQSKDSLASAMLTMMNSGLMTEDELKVLMMRML